MVHGVCELANSLSHIPVCVHANAVFGIPVNNTIQSRSLRMICCLSIWDQSKCASRSSRACVACVLVRWLSCGFARVARDTR